MICERCHGTGRVMRDALPVTGVMPGDPDRGGSILRTVKGVGTIWEPCRDCGSSGLSHCCDGERTGNAETPEVAA